MNGGAADSDLAHLSIDAPVEAGPIVALLEGAGAAVFLDYMRRQRWFGAKARAVSRLEVVDVGGQRGEDDRVRIPLLLSVRFAAGGDETYYVPLAVARYGTTPVTVREDAGRRIAHLQTPDGAWLVYEALWDDDFVRDLLRQALDGGVEPLRHGEMAGIPSAAIRGSEGGFPLPNPLRVPHPEGTRRGEGTVPPLPLGGCPSGRGRRPGEGGPSSDSIFATIHRLGAEQSNTTIRFGDLVAMKVFRRIEWGANPELDICRFLTHRTTFRGMPSLVGHVEYRPAAGAQRSSEFPTVAVVTEYVANQGDGWVYTLHHLGELFSTLRRDALATDSVAAGARIAELASDYRQAVQSLGVLTADLHMALASDREDSVFRPEIVTSDDAERWISESLRLARARFELVAGAVSRGTAAVRPRLLALPGRFMAVERSFSALRSLAGTGAHKIRLHGDYHLGQVLWTGADFVVFDFEGEPAIALSQRRAKRPVLKDVAGMLRSFDYASYAGFARQLDTTGADDAGSPTELNTWRLLWRSQVRGEFLDAYLERARRSSVPLIPESDAVLRAVLSAFELEKAIYELAYEVNNRPDWVQIPLAAVEAALM